MKNLKKIVALLLCAVLLVAGSVAGTLAYLTSQDEVVNTFTVGNVQIKLDEAEVNPDGTYVTDHENRVKGNEYHLLPGHSYSKDPTVTVLQNSEDCYVRMKVEVKNLHKLKAAMPQADFPAFYNGDVFLLQALTPDWNEAEWAFEKVDGNVYEFRYNWVVPKNTNSDTVLSDLFHNIKVPGEINNEQLQNLAKVEIIVTAEAIQYDGFANADAAWTAFDAQQ